VGGQQPSWLKYVWSDGTHYDVTNSSNWSSTQPAVATVLSAGGSYPGLVTGVSGGTSTISAYYYPQVPVDTGGQVCGNPPICPTVLVSGSEPVTVLSLQCTPSTVTRGQSVTCTAGGVTAGQVTGWSFSGVSGGQSFPVVGPAGTLSWSGTMVLGGTVTVTAAGKMKSGSITVNPRSSGFTATMPTPQQVPNGSMVGNQQLDTLVSPPTTDEGSMGEAAYGWGYHAGNSTGSGPNAGIYYVSSFTDQSLLGWEVNPALQNPNDPFYQSQGGCYATVSEIFSRVQSHEAGATSSHWSEGQAALQQHNPAAVAEASVSFNPGDLTTDINNAYIAVKNAAAPEPPNNLSDLRINYWPYPPCQ
jgi:hypothetical protein